MIFVLEKLGLLVYKAWRKKTEDDWAPGIQTSQDANPKDLFVTTAGPWINFVFKIYAFKCEVVTTRTPKF